MTRLSTLPQNMVNWTEKWPEYPQMLRAWDRKLGGEGFERRFCIVQRVTQAWQGWNSICSAPLNELGHFQWFTKSWLSKKYSCYAFKILCCIARSLQSLFLSLSHFFFSLSLEFSTSERGLNIIHNLEDGSHVICNAWVLWKRHVLFQNNPL